MVKGRREEDASLSAINERGKTSGFERNLSVKQLRKYITIYTLINSDSVGSSDVHLSTGEWEAAHASTRGVSGCLLDEGAANKL